MQPYPQTYTSTPPVPIPMAVPTLGISTISTPSVEKTTESQGVPVMTLKCHHLTPMLVTSTASPLPFTSSPSSSLPPRSASYTMIVISKLAIPIEAYPGHVNWPSDKDYLCHLCTFKHSNLNCILTHIRKHLNLTIGCPGCGKGFQNTVSLANMGRRYTRFKLLHPQRNIESSYPSIYSLSPFSTFH